MKKIFLLLSCLFFLAVSNSSAGVLYGIDRTDNTLVSISTETFIVSTIGSLGTNEEFGGLAYNINSGIMYLAGGRNNNSIYTVDYSSGLATSLGFHGIGDVFGLAFDTLNNVLYGSTSTQQLYSFDLNSGSATLIGNTLYNIGGLAYDSKIDRLIGIATGGTTIFELSRSTGFGTPILGSLPWTNDVGFTYDFNNDIFYSLGLNGELYSYSSVNFSSSLQASGLPDIDGLTYVSDAMNVPEPESFILLLFGLVGVFFLRKYNLNPADQVNAS